MPNFILNSVANYGNTAGMLTGPFLSRPQANTLPEGTIYVSNDTGAIYTVNGGVWVAVSGSGSVNPTTQFIPVNSAGSFIDSSIENVVDTFLQTFKNTTIPLPEGLYLDFQNSVYYFGDFNVNDSGTYFFVDRSNSKIACKNQSIENGLILDFSNKFYYFGDYNGINNNTYIGINDNQKIIFTSFDGNENGLFLSESSKEYKLGNYFNDTYLYLENNRIRTFVNGSSKGLTFDYNSNEYLIGDIALQSVLIKASYNDKEMLTYYDGNKNGFWFDFNQRQYFFGDTGAINNSTVLLIDDNAQYFSLQSSANYFDVNLLSGNAQLNFSQDFGTTTAGSNATMHLKISINGVNYVIPLKNP